ncbi:glycoside hydrolase family 13 protein [Vibrio crassostreae]|uniref:glycoside hydrolase family 13 protein n=1 Tax=Vibrio crassostreae TaxID=246167 RepID=UPI000F4613FF|nr:alpha-glucosidase [Vibrio crassostreae]ROP22427.1 oligo-1,6-glucosidase [Vibrio crassostreae]ROP23522.1 oligo-1,6-glucosidase [Vibrio crassostreae]RPE97943.1 oligo-1,6-glucosidase [Vibrio crassostreae]RPF02265.1 oligo-1,6-glucosidase [Vibrio crassostreae]TCN69012.1 oligo-1,6-glucosidase [Vibrio crassostreae]
MEQKWWHDAVVYQIYPRSFLDSNNDGIGDLNGIISKLDYLKELGINVIWLSPVYQSPMDDNGYDISNYQAIAKEFGSMEDMKRLMDEAKKRDIKIVMDLVVNHTSDEHRWFEQARSSKDNPYRDYYIWRDAKPDGSAPDDQESIFGGSAWHWDEQTQQYFFHLFSKRQPDLNWENPKVQEEVHNMMNWWIDLGIGGFRLDVIDLIGKEIDKGITGNGPRLHKLLQQMNQATFGNKDLLTVGETWGATPEIAKLYSGQDRNELSMVFQFEHITLTWENGDKWNPIPLDLREFKNVLTKWQLELADGGWNSLFWNNHDLPRLVSKYGDDKNYRVESAKMLATCLHFLKGTPYIYQGEEIGMTNVAFDSLDQYKDIETHNFYKVKTESGITHEHMMDAIHENSRDNARTPMHWSNQANAGFSGGTPWIELNPNYPQINVEDALSNPNSIFYHYKKLIELRKAHPAIVYGSFVPVFEEHDKVFAYVRELGGEQLLVVCNFSGESLALETPEQYQTQTPVCLISNYGEILSVDAQLHLAPYESFALKL